MTDFTNPPELTARYKEQVVPSVLPAGFAQALLPAKVPAVPIQLSFCFPPKPKKKPIELILDRLSEMDIPGKEHLEEYLRHQYRRNFKFSTLRGNLTACQLFLGFLKDSGIFLEQITRQDIEAFVEHELDRGVTIVTVRTRLATVYAFLRFMNERGIVEAELLEAISKKTRHNILIMQYNQNGTYKRTMETDRVHHYIVNPRQGPQGASSTRPTRSLGGHFMDITDRCPLERYTPAVSTVPNMP